MNEYIDYISQPENYNIQDAELRSQILRDTDIDNDSIIIDYLSSKVWVDKSHKTKKSEFTDRNFSYPASYLCSYAIHPDRKLHNILTSEQLKNRGREPEEREKVTYDEHNNETRTKYYISGSFTRNIYAEEIYEPRRTGNYKNADNSNSDEGHSNKNYNEIYHDNSTSRDLSVIKLSDPKHVRILLYQYAEWRDSIIEDDYNIDSELTDLLNKLDDIINLCNFNNTEKYLISLIKKSKYTHTEILDIMNKKYGNIFTYRIINHSITEKIPLKIAKVAKRTDIDNK